MIRVSKITIIICSVFLLTGCVEMMVAEMAIDTINEANKRLKNKGNQRVNKSSSQKKGTTPSSNSTPSAEQTAVQRKAEQLEEQLAALKAEQKQEQ